MWVDNGLMLVALVALGTKYPYGSGLWVSTALSARSGHGSVACPCPCPCPRDTLPSHARLLPRLCHPVFCTHTPSSLPVGIGYQSHLILGHGPGTLTPLWVRTDPWWGSIRIEETTIKVFTKSFVLGISAYETVSSFWDECSGHRTHHLTSLTGPNPPSLVGSQITTPVLSRGMEM